MADCRHFPGRGRPGWPRRATARTRMVCAKHYRLHHAAVSDAFQNVNSPGTYSSPNPASSPDRRRTRAKYTARTLPNKSLPPVEWAGQGMSRDPHCIEPAVMRVDLAYAAINCSRWVDLTRQCVRFASPSASPSWFNRTLARNLNTLLRCRMIGKKSKARYP